MVRKWVRRTSNEGRTNVNVEAGIGQPSVINDGKRNFLSHLVKKGDEKICLESKK